MQYYATITNQYGDQLLKVALRNLTYEQRSLRPAPIPSRWGADVTYQQTDEPETVSMDGIIVARLAGAEVPRVIPEERQIYVPE